MIVLPGLGADDRSTVAIRSFLSSLGYDVHGWNLGRNVRPSDADMPAIVTQIARLRAATNLPVSLVGWSRGGISATAPGHSPHGDYTRKPFCRATCQQCGQHLASSHGRQRYRPVSGGYQAARKAYPRSGDLHLHPIGWCGCLAGMSRRGRTKAGEYRGEDNPYRPWIHPPALGAIADWPSRLVSGIRSDQAPLWQVSSPHRVQPKSDQPVPEHCTIIWQASRLDCMVDMLMNIEFALLR